jgi:hypothetical protein
MPSSAWNAAMRASLPDSRYRRDRNQPRDGALANHGETRNRPITRQRIGRREIRDERVDLSAG